MLVFIFLQKNNFGAKSTSFGLKNMFCHRNVQRVSTIAKSKQDNIYSERSL